MKTIVESLVVILFIKNKDTCKVRVKLRFFFGKEKNSELLPCESEAADPIKEVPSSVILVSVIGCSSYLIRLQ